MKQEDKELLLKDLCVRLPYGVKVLYNNEVFGVEYVSPMYEEVKLDTSDNWTVAVSDIKPYLFPISSMTEEEKEEFNGLFNGTFQYFNDGVISASYLWDRNEAKFVGTHECSKLIDWFNAHHFDHRDLIEKGLAIDATGLNIY